MIKTNNFNELRLFAKTGIANSNKFHLCFYLQFAIK